jgi:hypothetical protein
MKLAHLMIVAVFSGALLCDGQSSDDSARVRFKCGKVISTFNQSKNETQVQLRPLILEGVFHIAPGETLITEASLPNDDHGVALTALYTYPGKVPSKAESILIVIEAEGTKPVYEKERTLSMNVDGAVLTLGWMDRAVQRTNLGLIREDLSITISRDTLMKITNAKKARINLGATNFTLTECHLDALRKFSNFPRS